MSSSRENSPDRQIPRGKERGKHRRRRHETQDSKRHPREEFTEDDTKDFRGGTPNNEGSEEVDPSYRATHRPSQARKARPSARTRPERSPISSSFREGVDFPSRKHHQPARYPSTRVSDENDPFLSEPPDGDWSRGEWIHAAKEVVSRNDPSPEHTVLSLEPTLFIHRRGRLFRSESFYYERGWTDKQFAEALKRQYASLKVWEVGLAQKFVAYKQIHYVYVLQFRFLRRQRKWMVVKLLPITTESDKEARDVFMNLLRHPSSDMYRRQWTETIDDVIKPGVILSFEIIETLDTSRINLGIVAAAIFSLVIALVYGFAMDNDFSTGFSIGSWFITAAGFIGALISISQYAGPEIPASSQMRVGMDDAETMPN